MYHDLLQNTIFHAFLTTIDDELANKVREARCLCGGALHRADYPRSPLGLTVVCREYYESRRSFCCDQCRKRVTTPSVRFFGRHRFPAPTFVLLSFLKRGVAAPTLKQVRRHFGIDISKRTWRRWCRWWREGFIATAFWKQAKGICPTGDPDDDYPRSLRCAYSGSFSDQWVAVLRFLAPLTAGVYRAA